MIIPSFKKIGEQAMRAAKKEWWLQNGKEVESDSLLSRSRKQKTKGFQLPDKSIRLVYLHIDCVIKNDRMTGGRPVGCLVTCLSEDGPFNVMEYQYSSCNPLDKFSKEIGRTLAIERLASQPLSVRGSKNASAYDLKYALTELLSEGEFSDKSSDLIDKSQTIDFTTIPLNIRFAATEWLDYRDKMEFKRTKSQTQVD